MASVDLESVVKVCEGGVHAVRDSKLSIADRGFIVLVQALGDKMNLPFFHRECPRGVAHLDVLAGLAAGQRLRVCVDLARVHFFENSESGRSLVRGPSQEVS